MAKKYMLCLATAFLVVMGIFLPTSASAKARHPKAHAAFGQCGGYVSNGVQLLRAWNRMGVTSQAMKVVARSGQFHRMDGSERSFMRRRTIKARLASAQAPEDFGCHPGVLFSVGHRTMAKGTPVIVVLPRSLSRHDVSVRHRRGFKARRKWAFAIGKTDCSNALSGKVKVVLYIRKRVRKHHKKRHRKPRKRVVVVKPAPPQVPSITIINNNSQSQSQSQSQQQQQQQQQQTPPPPPSCTTCSCQGNCPPPPVSPPAITGMTQPQEVYSDGETYPNFCFSVSLPNNDSGTLSLSPQYGTFSPSGPFQVRGEDRVCATYVAPNTPDAGGKTESVAVFVRDSSTGLSASKTVTFPIMSPPSNPN